MTRQWALFTALMTVVLVLATQPAVVEQVGWSPWWFDAVAVTAVLVLPAAVVVGALLVPFPVLRAALRATVAGAAATMALVPFVVDPGAITGFGWFWVLTPTSTLVCLAVVAEGDRGLALVPALGVLAFVANWWVHGADALVDPFRATLGPVSFGMLFAAAALLAQRTATAYDAALRDLEAEAEARAAAQATKAERDRLHALAHDVVMTTLNTVGHTTDIVAASRAVQHCVAMLDAVNAEPEGGPVSVAEVVRTLRQACTDTDALSVFTSAAADPSAHFPAHVVDAFDSVLREALRNTTRHARSVDPHVSSTVRVEAAAGELVLTASDNGPGFDPDAVPDTRLGIALSMRARVDRLHGGRIEVRSRPGEGVVVRLVWLRAGWSQ